MKRELAAFPDPTGPTSSGALAQELAKQVARVLATGESSTPGPGRHTRDRRQDALWDCAGVLQSVGRAPNSERLVEQLKDLPDLLAHSEASEFAERLAAWTDETWTLIGGNRPS
ncbi:MAG: hypothetical protein AAGA48_37940 [Myxococcota bacterium]